MVPLRAHLSHLARVASNVLCIFCQVGIQALISTTVHITSSAVIKVERYFGTEGESILATPAKANAIGIVQVLTQRPICCRGLLERDFQEEVFQTPSTEAIPVSPVSNGEKAKVIYVSRVPAVIVGITYLSV